MRRPRRVRVQKSVIPGAFTLLNMFFGFSAILSAARGEIGQAAWLIVIAAALDAVDGRLARLFGSSSRFGIEYDSLADLISFCAAPSTLLYFAFLQELDPLTGSLIASLPLILGGIRLARFNLLAVDGETGRHFQGLTTTMNAVSLSSYILFNLSMTDFPGEPKVVLPLATVLSFLMLSRIPYAKLPDLAQGGHRPYRLSLLGGGIVALAIWGEWLLLPLSALYVLSGIVNRLTHHEAEEAEWLPHGPESLGEHHST